MQRPNTEQIFHEARAIRSTREREGYLKGACGNDMGLRAKVEALLKADEVAGSFLEGADQTDGSDVTAIGTVLVSRTERAGQMIGRYKLLQQIGEGGFGTVWMAEQERPVVRRVALKIIKLGMDTRQVIARFEAERQALAMMEHPNIARVLDAGATESGRPYFVMELVKGEPITGYCDRNNLAIPERLELFAQVCQAVQHAHTKGIIHRDVKPTNVLVTTQDGRPLAKIIDFGIAKATCARLTEKTLFTEHRQLIGTLEYMAPEQAEGSPDIDTRTDIYSLGVLLYELLTGLKPFDPKDLRSAAYGEIQRIIREVEPKPPSTRLSQATDTLPSLAAHRHTDPRSLCKLVRGELDWIVMKCMEKDRARRYDTASAIAEDVLRYLAHEPVSAGAPGRAYRLTKLIRRNSGIFAAAAAVALALVLGLAAASYGLVQARAALAAAERSQRLAQAERDAKAEALAAAERSQRRTEIVQGFFREIISAALPDAAQGRLVKVSDVMDLAAQRADEMKDPAAQAELRYELGAGYSALGLFGEARNQLERSLEIRRGLPDLRDRAETMLALGNALRQLQLGDRGESLARDARRMFAELDGEESISVLQADIAQIRTLTVLQQWDDVAARVDQTLKRIDSLDPDGVQADMHAALLDLQHQVFLRQKKFEQAGEVLMRAVEVKRRAGEAGSMRVASSLSNLSRVLAEMGKLDDAFQYAQEALEMRKRALPPVHSQIAQSLYYLGFIHGKAQEFDEALQCADEARVMYGQCYRQDHPSVALALDLMANIHVARGGEGDLESAAERVATAITIWEAQERPDAVSLADARSRRGDILSRLGQHEEAEPLLLEAYEILRSENSGRWVAAKRTAEALARLYEEIDEPVKAEKWKSNVVELQTLLER